MRKPKRGQNAGSVDQLASGRYRARFSHHGTRDAKTFDTKAAAEGWLAASRRAAVDGTWQPAAKTPTPTSTAPLFQDYAATWLEHRTTRGRPLKPRTRQGYEGYLTRDILPTFGKARLDQITTGQVKVWHRDLLPGKAKARADAYALLHAILATATEDEIIPSNPAKIRSATQAPRRPRVEVPTPEQVNLLIQAMPEGKYRVATMLAAWSGLRFGELTELRAGDVVWQDGAPVAVRVRRGVVRVKGGQVVDTPKSDAGIRNVSIPPHVRPALTQHLEGVEQDGLLFQGTVNRKPLAHSSLMWHYNQARQVTGLTEVNWHRLRHFNATYAAMAGATLAELMNRLGHSTVNAAIVYQHATDGRDQEIGDRLSQFAQSGNVVPIRGVA